MQNFLISFIFFSFFLILDANAKTNVCYLGPDGSYSEMAVKQMPHLNDIVYKPLETFQDVYNNVLNEECIGVLPIENSITTDIYENISFLFKNKDKIQILAEIMLPIKLSLIGLASGKFNDISTIYSDEKSLQQASNFIISQGYYTNISQSISSAKDFILKEQKVKLGYIGNKDNLPLELKVFQEDIANFTKNITRFLIISKNSDNLNGNKFDVVFITNPRKCTLASFLVKLEQNGVNITKIFPMQIPGTSFEYQFFIEGSRENITKSDLLKFSSYTESLNILGVYSDLKLIRYE